MPMSTGPQIDDDEGGLDFGQVLAALRRRVWLIAGVTVVVAAGAVYKAMSDTPIYQSKFEILTEPVTVETQVISSANPQALSSREEIVSVVPDEARLKLLTSPQVLDPVVEQLQSEYPGITYKALSRGLQVKPGGDNILVVRYKHPNPTLVESVLELVSATFLNYSLEARQKDIVKGIEFVEEQLLQLRPRVDAQQERLQALRQRNNLIDPEAEGQKLSTQITAVEQQRLDTQLQLSQAEALYASLQRELANATSAEFAVASILSESARYQELLSQLREIDNQIAKESVLYLEESPELKILQEQRESLLPLLEQEAGRVSEEWAAKIQELEERDFILQQTIERLNQQIKRLSVVSREYNDIQRELQIATDNLNQFLAKREAFKIDMAQRQAPWELLTFPDEPRPSSASVPTNAVLGTVLGLLLGVGLALLVDRLNDVIYTAKEVKEVTRLPILGIIPLDKKLKAVVSLNTSPARNGFSNGHELEVGNGYSKQEYVVSSFHEAFRSLYTNIRLLTPDSTIRSFVVSSTTAGEGKSTTAIYLARAAAEQGKRVLLVDTDLRRPTVHQKLGLMNLQGLTDVISTDMDFNHAIQQSPLDNNLFVLTSGSIPPDSIRILSSKKMIDLMHKLKEVFDLVIYDAPPMLGLADANLIAAETKGMVLVAGLGTTKRSELGEAIAQLKEHSSLRTPVLGMVANRAKNVKSSHSYSYGYYTTGVPPAPESLGSEPVTASSEAFLAFFRKKSK